LDDAEPILAVARFISTWSAAMSGAAVDLAAAETLAQKLDDLIATDEGAGDVATILRTFAPFATGADILSFLDDPGGGGLRASRDIGGARSYGAAISATWGPAAAAIAAATVSLEAAMAVGAAAVSIGLAGARAGPAAAAAEAVAARVEQEIVAVCGICAIPLSLLVFSLDREEAFHLLGSVSLALEAVHLRITRDRPADPQIRALRADLDNLLRRKQSQLQSLTGDMPEFASPDDRPLADRLAALEYVGALLELWGESIDLGDELANTSIPRHKLVSHLTKLGLTDPILIDQNPQLDRLKAVQPKVDAWITETLALAAQDPRNAELAHAVDRIAVTLGAIRTRFTIIQITERLIDDGKYELWEDLKDTTETLDTAIVFLEADRDYDNVRRAVVKASSNASLLIQSYKWSRLVHQAMRDAMDVILMLETGGRMGGVGPSLQLATAGAAARAFATSAELDRLLAGATVVAMAAKGDPQKGRRKGIKAEKGLGLSPNRPRDKFLSITDTATVRFPDNLLIRFRTFWEVKNVLNLRLTRQMTDFILYAQNARMKMVLYIRPTVAGKAGTTLAPALKDALKILRKEGLLKIRYLKIY
jgi:hypothetical protein